MLLTADINPQKLKTLSLYEKSLLCDEIRSLLISVVSKNGGHLASNLGAVELTVALHSVFTTPKDKLIFDVGHQAYTHKILTGRLESFPKLRREGGVSGFPRPSESEHDAFIGGHSSISVSAGLGIAAANSILGEDGDVVVIAGDGAFSGGGIYEGLNNAGRKRVGKKNSGKFIVILNDNGMSISKSSGALASYLSQIRTKGYYEAKNRIKQILNRTALGKKAKGAVSETKRFVKNALIHENIFENLGFRYFGPVDGHNLEELIYIFDLVKNIENSEDGEKPCLIHVKTKKGKGYIPAEENAGHYHGLSAEVQKNKPTYSEIFGQEILKLGGENEKICLVTAAMKYATGCNFFYKKYPERFFDAGIAEAHAATFAAGLASRGLLPVFAVYSTFLQRAFDQLLHDVSIENLRLVLAIDRAGLSGEDGPTHQGTFDVGLISMLPNSAVYAPLTAEELRLCLRKALFEDSGISAVRYPRGIAYDPENEEPKTDYALYKCGAETDKLIITYGRPVKPARRLLKDGVDVLRLVKLHPLPDEVFEIVKDYKDIYFFEEGSGAAEKFKNAKIRNITKFIPVADVERQLKICGLDEAGMKEFIGI